VNAPTANLDSSPAARRPLWAAAALSFAAHVALMATLGSVVTTSWRNADLADAPVSRTPLQVSLIAAAAKSDAKPVPEESPVELSSPTPRPPAVQSVPQTAAEPTPVPMPMPMPPGLSRTGVGEAGTPHLPPPPPTDFGDIAVGPTTDLSPFGTATRLRLAALYPVKPGRLPRLSGTLTVTYPDYGLRDHSSARVGALLLLDTKGAVVETIVEPDDTMFAPVVREALSRAVFLPAQAADTPLPYWIALEFVFTIDPAKASAKP